MRPFRYLLPLIGSTLIFFSLVFPAYSSYSLGYVKLQNIVKENGDNYNRLYFEVYNSIGQWVLDENVVLDAILYEPNGDVVQNIDELNFNVDPIMLGSYDGSSGRWNYPDFITITSFTGKIFDPLITGQYRLVVLTSEGEIENIFQFNGSIDLPIISSKTFEIQTDVNNNVLWKWKIPDAVFSIDPNLQTSARSYIVIYDDNTYKGLVWITVPTHLGYLFIPASIATQIGSMGDKFQFVVQLRTNDNNNRSYSNALELLDVHANIHHPSSDFDWDCDVDAYDLHQFSVDFGLSNTCQVND